MEGCELIANLRRNQSSGIAAANYYNAGANDSDALYYAALSYRIADSYASEPPVFWPFKLEFWKPEDKLTNLMRAGVLYQEAAEFKEKLTGNGAKYQHEAIEVAEEIDSLLTTDSTPL
jgi:hypothetical protein